MSCASPGRVCLPGSALPGLAGRQSDEAIFTLCRLLGKGDAIGELKTEAEPTEVGRFTQMLPDRADSPAGELEGTRLLSPRTVRYMTRNHLPGGLDLETFGRPLYAESPFRGVGFGLGFAVVIDPVPGKVLCSVGVPPPVFSGIRLR